MSVGFDGFDWDHGNRDKCRKHGVEIETIETIFHTGNLRVRPDIYNSIAETRFNAVGGTVDGRSIFVVFTLRERGGQRLIRPISARYMHDKEIAAFEKENP